MKPLTPTEKHILDLVGQGMSSVEIAVAMNLSEHTVESHRRNMLAKFGAKNAAEMVKKAIYSRVMSSGQEEVPKTQII